MTMEQKGHYKLSIITPIYNLQEYLDRCIQSILAQKYSDFELILVDDGSTDRSAEIIDSYAERDRRIKVVHKANGGVSSARNKGLEVAHGEWIFFCDGDDELYEDSLELMMSKTIENDIDFVMFGYETYDENNKKVYSMPDRKEALITADEGLRYMFRPRYHKYWGFVHTKLFRRECISKSNLRFVENIYFNEDRLFCVQYLCAISGSVYFTTTPLYKYFERNNSAMCSLKTQFNEKALTELDAYTLMLRDMQTSGKSQELLMLCKKDFLSSIRGVRRMTRHFRVSDSNVMRRLRHAKYHEIGVQSYITLRFRELKKSFLCKCNL